jgi:chromosome segregation ATPase
VARECFRKADEDARSFSLAMHDARERLAGIEEKARRITEIESRALEADQLEERSRGLESSLKAAEKQVREAEAAAESARKSAKLSKSARLHDSALLQQSMDKTTRLNAEVEKLKAQDIERQEEIFNVQRLLNDAQRNASQLTSRVSVLETEVVRAVEDLSMVSARREVADGQLSALRTVAVSIADAVLGAGSSAADPFEHLCEVPERLRA